MGEIYRVCAALKGKSGDNAAWFEEWNKMGEKVALLAEQAKDKGYLQTASGAYMRGAHYIQIGERLRQPRTPETQKAYARSIELFKKGLPDVPFLSVDPVEIPFEGEKVYLRILSNRGGRLKSNGQRSFFLMGWI